MRPTLFTAWLLALTLAEGHLEAQSTSSPAIVASISPPIISAHPWDTWPLGRLFGGGPDRPPEGALRICSFEAPICVHARSQEGEQALRVLQEAEVAHRFFLYQARLSRLEGDAQGGSSAVDLYLKDLQGSPLRIGFDLPTHFPYDRAPIYAILEQKLTGCARSTAVHRALAIAHLAAIDAGAFGGTFATSAAYLAMMSTGCNGEVLAALDTAQAHPEAPILPPSEPDASQASPLLWWWLESTMGQDAPGSLVTGLWYSGVQSTPLDFTRFKNDPDLLAVLRRLALHRKTTLDSLLLDFAVARAFVGERDDGQHWAETAWLGAAGRIRFESSWPYKTLPRRLAFTPLEPTGSTYVWVDLQGAPPHPRLGFHVRWEHPVTMRWALVRVSKDGEEQSRMVIPYRRGIFEADAILEELEDMAGVIIVGVNNGGISLSEPQRLDEAPYEPHGGTIHIFQP